MHRRKENVRISTGVVVRQRYLHALCTSIRNRAIKGFCGVVFIGRDLPVLSAVFRGAGHIRTHTSSREQQHTRGSVRAPPLATRMTRGSAARSSSGNKPSISATCDTARRTQTTPAITHTEHVPMFVASVMSRPSTDSARSDSITPALRTSTSMARNS